MLAVHEEHSFPFEIHTAQGYLTQWPSKDACLASLEGLTLGFMKIVLFMKII